MQLYYKQQKMMVDDGDMSKSNMSKSNQASPALRRKKKLIGFWGPYLVSVKKWNHKYWNIARSGKFLVQPNPEKNIH